MSPEVSLQPPWAAPAAPWLALTPLARPSSTPSLLPELSRCRWLRDFGSCPATHPTGHGARCWVWASLPQGLASGWSRGQISGPEAGEGFVLRGLVATGSGGLPLGLLGFFLQPPSEPVCRPVLPGQLAWRGFIGVGAAIKGVSSRHRLHLPSFRRPACPQPQKLVQRGRRCG